MSFHDKNIEIKEKKLMVKKQNSVSVKNEREFEKVLRNFKIKLKNFIFRFTNKFCMSYESPIKICRKNKLMKKNRNLINIYIQKFY